MLIIVSGNEFQRVGAEQWKAWLIFFRVMQQNKTGCFFLNTVYNQTPTLTKYFCNTSESMARYSPSSLLQYHVCWYIKLDAKFQTIRLTARHLLTDTVTKVEPQIIAFSAVLICQTKVVSLHYSKQAAHLQWMQHCISHTHTHTHIHTRMQKHTWLVFSLWLDCIQISVPLCIQIIWLTH